LPDEIIPISFEKGESEVSSHHNRKILMFISIISINPWVSSLPAFQK
jgi:hypothetical protein